MAITNPQVGSPEYESLHDTCPKCSGSGDKMKRTDMQFIGTCDWNKCSCPCGWSGIVHNRLPSKQDGRTS